jgi:hypothetical protein
VTASGLVIDNGEPTIYVAKNGIGNDAVEDMERMKKDEELAQSLTIWIRIIASTMKRPTINKDHMWMKLVDYYKQRLNIYASQIEFHLKMTSLPPSWRGRMGFLWQENCLACLRNIKLACPQKSCSV